MWCVGWAPGVGWPVTWPPQPSWSRKSAANHQPVKVSYLMCVMKSRNKAMNSSRQYSQAAHYYVKWWTLNKAHLSPPHAMWHKLSHPNHYNSNILKWLWSDSTFIMCALPYNFTQRDILYSDIDSYLRNETIYQVNLHIKVIC